ncbi:PRC-barrel domain-containing protein [Azospirillum sp.]|uniref:PRC-barrel domain-containing protein n=1 Tax=Azospirillum sp. TaxID=34012 RepID=UPI003D75D2B0
MRRLLPLAALLLLGACASRYEVMSPQPVTNLSPLELQGREVLSSTGREVGQVDDVVQGTDGRPAQIIVGVGAPMTMVRRHVAVGVDEGRFSAPQNAIVLNGDLTPEQVASRPDLGTEDRMVALSRPVVGSGHEPTNWYRATEPAPR